MTIKSQSYDIILTGITDRLYQVKRRLLASSVEQSEYACVKIRELLLSGHHIHFYVMDLDHTVICARGYDNFGRRFY